MFKENDKLWIYVLEFEKKAARKRDKIRMKKKKTAEAMLLKITKRILFTQNCCFIYR